MNIIDYLNKLLLQCGDVETNPGPVNIPIAPGQVRNNVKIKIATYNINGGLSKPLKQKRILNKIRRLDPNTIFCLQETHLVTANEFVMKARWNNGISWSHGTAASAGTAILFKSKEWDETVEVGNIEGGRCCYVILKKENLLLMVINVYAPNKAVDSVVFYDTVNQLLIDKQANYPGVSIAVAGDFNVTLSESDSVNRVGYAGEDRVRDRVETLLEDHALFDIKKFKFPLDCKPTFKRNRTMSRLDYVCVDNVLYQNVTDYQDNWSFDQSDHAMIFADLIIESDIIMGKGYFKANSKLLEFPQYHQQIKEHILNSIEQSNVITDPHVKWDYIKMEIRNIFMEIGKENSQLLRSEIALLEKENNHLIEKIKEAVRLGKSEEIISTLEEDQVIVRDQLEKTQDLISEKLLFRSKCEYVEKGEKSNKYFLNLINRNQKRSCITKIDIEGRTYKGKEMGNVIADFYKTLYSKDDIDRNCENIINNANLPKLSIDDKAIIDGDITLEELHEVLSSSKDSCPGIDGIPYSVYKEFWSILSPHLLASWNKSIEIGQLSKEQKHSIISLLQKPGKPVGDINNLRPISLSNCDIKLVTKALSRRISKVVNIFSNTQTAYLKNRRATDNINLLQAITEICDKEDFGAFVVSLDATKAFDSIDHEFMHKVLQEFGFGDKFLNTLKMLYNDLSAEVMINGVRFGKFIIKKGVKQGDALSCVIFILCMEVLIRNIQNNQEIKGVKIKNPLDGVESEIKVVAFADDTTPVVRDVESIRQIFETYSQFTHFSGIQLNKNKTEILPIGTFKDNLDNITIDQVELKVVNKTKICGFVLSCDADILYNENVIKTIEKLKTKLNPWRQRNLTTQGNILLVKTFGMSQLTYVLNCISIKQNEIKSINKEIYNFIWRGRDKIKREILQLDYQFGGLKAPNLDTMIFSAHIKQYCRFSFDDLNHPIKTAWNIVAGYRSVCNFNSLKQVSKSDYLKKSIREFDKFSFNIYSWQLQSSFLMKTYDSLRNNHDTMTSIEYKVRLAKSSLDTYEDLRNKDIIRRLKRFDFKTVLDVITRQNPVVFLELASIKNKIGMNMINALTHANQNNRLNEASVVWSSVCIDENKFENCKKSSQFRFLKVFNESIGITKEQILNKLNLDPDQVLLDDLNPFIKLRKTTGEIRLRDFQYKILMSTLVTRKKLCDFRIIDDPSCLSCVEVNEIVNDNIRHSFYECPTSRKTWENVKTVLLNSYEFQFEINEINCILGMQGRLKKVTEINELLIIIRKTMHAPVNKRKALTCNEISSIFESRGKVNRLLQVKKLNEQTRKLARAR